MSQKLQPLICNGVRERDLYFDVKTSVIYFLKSIDGRKVKFSTGIKDNAKTARRIANQKLNKKINSKKLTLQSLIRDELANWLVVKENEGHAYDTLNNIRRAKKQIEQYWGPKFPREITADNLTDWYAWWRENNPDIEMENAVKYMRNFCRYLTQKIVLDRPLLPIVPKIQDPNYKKIRRARKKKKERIFSAADFKKIMATAENDSHALVVLIMYTMATRITETLELRWDKEVHYSGTSGEWTYRWSDGQNKADHVGWHVFHPAVGYRLSTFIFNKDYNGRLFPQEKDKSKALREQQIDWDGWRKRADLGWHWTPHTFRHTCLSNLFNDEKNPQALICKLYRVSLAVAMETYIKPTESGIEKMRNAIKVEL